MDARDPALSPAGLIRTRRGRPLILLFYDGFEMKADPGVLGWARSNGRRAARHLWRSLRGKQVHTGFYAAFRALVASLRHVGCEVQINAFGLAAKHPDYPIGVAGYPSVLEKVDLPNPRLFGPGDYGYPDAARRVADDPRNRILTQPGDWAASYYRPYVGHKVRRWFAGIDTRRYADASGYPKSLDVLVYDKIRWHRETEVPRVLDAVTAQLAARGLSFAVLRYGAHRQGTFVSQLRRARAMVFLCEHETQGLAYQEALAMGVPVLAWDEGVLVDPSQRRFAAPDLVVSSVPYFDARCGARFRMVEGFGSAFDAFWGRLPEYRPRDYVLEALSLEACARAWLAAYASLLPGARERSDRCGDAGDPGHGCRPADGGRAGAAAQAR